MNTRHWALVLILITTACFAAPAWSDGESVEAAASMTVAKLEKLLRRIDKTARVEGNVIEFEIESYPLVMVFDEQADRMRLMSPIGKVADLDADELMRLMQANFDSALDARYAVANDILWGLFVHPLASLSEEEFLVAIGQTINVVATFGESYSSGVFVFGGGDSSAIERRKLIDRLKNFLST